MWIAQISDPHIRPDGVLYKGVTDSNAALAAAVRQINRLVPLPDLVLLTGDVTDEGTTAEYDAALAILAALRPRLLAIPGNHDDREPFRRAFAAWGYLPAEGPICYVDSGPVRIVALDVTVPGKHHGEVNDSALAWLDGVLAAEPDRPAVVMLHQQPFLCGVPYLDKYRCFGADRLENVVARHKSVQRVLCGHVHRQMQLGFGGTLLCSAPSTATAIALRPVADAEPTSFLETPGFLLHHWRPQGMLTHSVQIGDFSGPFPFA